MGVGGMAVLPEIKERRGLGPRTEEVTCVARGLRKMDGEKWVAVRGGSCWMLLAGCQLVELFSIPFLGLQYTYPLL